MKAPLFLAFAAGSQLTMFACSDPAPEAQPVPVPPAPTPEQALEALGADASADSVVAQCRRAFPAEEASVARCKTSVLTVLANRAASADEGETRELLQLAKVAKATNEERTKDALRLLAKPRVAPTMYLESSGTVPVFPTADRRGTVCYLPAGTAVTATKSQLDIDDFAWVVNVAGPKCKGWVKYALLSAQKPRAPEKAKTVFLDGRDEEAEPPLTVMNVNLWSDPWRARVVCTLRHGTEVTVSGSDGAQSLVAGGGGCSGWLSSDFLSAKRPGILGDRIE